MIPARITVLAISGLLESISLYVAFEGIREGAAAKKISIMNYIKRYDLIWFLASIYVFSMHGYLQWSSQSYLFVQQHTMVPSPLVSFYVFDRF